MRRLWVVVLWVVMPAAYAGAETGTAAMSGTAEDSSIAGSAVLADTPSGLQVRVSVEGVEPGAHGLHIHEFGECGDGGKAAGGHFNPRSVPHGYLPKDGAAQAHLGDMGNIDVGADGSGSLDVTLPGVSLGGAGGVAGRAIILHAQPDDFGQPTGNAGGRVGCGAIVISGSGA